MSDAIVTYFDRCHEGLEEDETAMEALQTPEMLAARDDYARSQSMVKAALDELPPRMPLDDIRYVHFRMRRVVLLAQYLLPSLGWSDDDIDHAIQVRYQDADIYAEAWDAFTTPPVPDRALTGRDRAPTVCDRRREQDLARRCHGWETAQPHRVTLADRVVRESKYDRYYFTTWCLHYGYDPATWKRAPRVKRPADIIAMLHRHNLLTHLVGAGGTRLDISPEQGVQLHILANYHYVARMINQWVRAELLADVMEADPALARALLRQWMKDATINDD